jgi:small subunit ribosomal protein S3
LGHKVHPTGFRLGVVKGWQSRWYAERDYKDLLKEDFKLRQLIQKELANASVSRTEIERAAANQVTVTIYTARPGIVIGKSGEKVDRLRASLEKATKKRVKLNIQEIRQPELDAYLVARSIAEQLERRVSFRRAMKQSVQKTMRANAKGIRIVIGGRLGGAEIARSEKEVEGKIPLHTLRADIDYGFAEAHTTFGVIGIKVWIYKGDILPSKRREALEGIQEAESTFGSERGEGDRRDRRPRGGARGERSDRPRGERSERSDRPARSQGERSSRGGDRPQGQQGQTVRPRGERSGADRPARPARSQAERPARPPRAPRAEGAATASTTPAATTVQPTPEPEQAPIADTNMQASVTEAQETQPTQQAEQAQQPEATQQPETNAPESE